MSATTTVRAALLGSVSASLLTLTAPIAAQDADEGARGFEEIIVSARRRDESLLEVPVAVTALNGDQLINRGVIDIIEVAKFAPNVTLEVSRGTNTTITAFIRGVGQQDPVAGFEAGVGLYFDDVYINRPQGAVIDIFDVERIEVLRGPQGTLYGRNTIGGAIKYVSKRIPDEKQVTIRGSVGTYDQFDGVIRANLPITDTLRVSAGFGSFNRGGFGENLNTGQDNYDKEIIAMRGSIEWMPREDLFFRLSGDHTDDTSSPRQGHRLIPGAFSGAPVLDDVFDTRAGLNVVEQQQENTGGSFLMEWDINENWKIKNILAYREDKAVSPIDFDSLPSPDLDVPVIYENDQFSEEFQVLYTDDKLAGVFGFYYLDASAFNVFDVLLGTTGDLIGLPGLNAQTLGDVDTETWALFADLTYQLTDTISISYGGRYTEDQRSSQILRTTFIGGFSDAFNGSGVPIATTSNFNGSETFTDYANRVSIAYQPTDEHNFYASFSQGFKGGGFDPRGQTTATPDFNRDGTVSDDEVFEFLSFEPEEVETWEIGWKSSLLDGRVTMQVAAFMSNYTNVQIPGSIGVDTTGDGISDTFAGITSNAADADINGIEWEGSAMLSTDVSGIGDSLRLDWALGFLDANYNEFIDATGQDVADQRVFQNTPDWTLGGTLDYSRPMEIGGMDGIFSFINAIAYRSAASQFEAPSAFLDQAGFALWDMSLVWGSEDGKYNFGLHWKNVTDKEYIVAGYNFVNEATTPPTPTLGLEGTLTAFYGNPSTLTATFEVNF